jgi:hypothetical protein
MRSTDVANLSVTLATLGWTILLQGERLVPGGLFLCLPRFANADNCQLSNAVISACTLCFMGALALSHYSSSAARWRAYFTVLLCIFPLGNLLGLLAAYAIKFH